MSCQRPEYQKGQGVSSYFPGQVMADVPGMIDAVERGQIPTEVGLPIQEERASTDTHCPQVLLRQLARRVCDRG